MKELEATLEQWKLGKEIKSQYGLPPIAEASFDNAIALLELDIAYLRKVIALMHSNRGRGDGHGILCDGQPRSGIYKLLRATPFSTAAFIGAMTGARTALTLVVSCCIVTMAVLMLGVTLHVENAGLIFLVGTHHRLAPALSLFRQAMGAAMHADAASALVWEPLAILAGFTVLCMTIATLTFRWDAEQAGVRRKRRTHAVSS